MESSPEKGAVAADGAPLDIEALINAFVADETQSSLELPRTLTADQRKQAKRLAEEHPELKCESYGFGAERSLHLFKKDAGRAGSKGAGQAVRVKNTFIDDFVDKGGEEGAQFRSMPVDLLGQVLQRCKLEESAESSGGTGEAGEAKAPEQAPLPALPDELAEALQVRNTFIHIESVPVVERIVQSMPDGMFRQCLEAELSAQHVPSGDGPAGAPRSPPGGVASSSPTVPEEPEMIPIGTEVVIEGLVKLPDFNGLVGVVQTIDPATGRYDVHLDSPAGSCGWKWVKVKGENLRPVVPPPPRNAPTISTDVDGQGVVAGGVPATPKWEEDYAAGANPGGSSAAAPLRLNALIP